LFETRFGAVIPKPIPSTYIPNVEKLQINEMIKQAGYNKLLNMNSTIGISTAVDRLIDKLSNNLSSLMT